MLSFFFCVSSVSFSNPLCSILAWFGPSLLFFFSPRKSRAFPLACLAAIQSPSAFQRIWHWGYCMRKMILISAHTAELSRKLPLPRGDAAKLTGTNSLWHKFYKLKIWFLLLERGDFPEISHAKWYYNWVELWSYKDRTNGCVKSLCRFRLSCCFTGVCGVEKEKRESKSEGRVTVVNKVFEHWPNGACLRSAWPLLPFCQHVSTYTLPRAKAQPRLFPLLFHLLSLPPSSLLFQDVFVSECH